MKFISILATILVTIGAAYLAANSKLHSPPDLHSLKIGMTAKDVVKKFGPVDAQDSETMTYIFEDSSVLTISIRDKIVSSANLKYHQPLKIEDPKLRELSLVQMGTDELESNNPSWFFAGKPEDGIIYKVTSNGTVESMTWVPPFTYKQENPKHLQALVREFKDSQTVKF